MAASGKVTAHLGKNGCPEEIRPPFFGQRIKIQGSLNSFDGFYRRLANKSKKIE